MQMTKTKYGYFPCALGTFKKIKRLYGYYHVALQQAANWTRWHAKKAENRVIEFRRHEDGQTKIGLVLPKPEPPLMPVFCKKFVVKSYFDSQGKYIPGGVDDEKVSVCDMGILALYDQTRRPKKYSKNLPEITFTELEINKMLLEIEQSKHLWAK